MLSTDHVLCVAREYAIIEEFLDQVTFERGERGVLGQVQDMAVSLQ